MALDLGRVAMERRSSLLPAEGLYVSQSRHGRYNKMKVRALKLLKDMAK
jgi:hypothetical protein